MLSYRNGRAATRR